MKRLPLLENFPGEVLTRDSVSTSSVLETEIEILMISISIFDVRRRALTNYIGFRATCSSLLWNHVADLTYYFNMFSDSICLLTAIAIYAHRASI